MITAQEIQTFNEAVLAANTIFISAHVGPDGDTLGSMLGIQHALKKHFSHLQRIDCVIAGKMPDSFLFMPGIDAVKNVETATDLLQQYDLAFCVDCGGVDRMGPGKAYFTGAKHSINIDHHFSNDRFGLDNIIDVEAAASGEVVADLLMGNNIPIPPEAATCLYVALLTDTGGFKYSSTSAKVFELAATLTRCGANPENIYRHIYEEAPKCQVQLHAEAIRQAEFNASNTLCWTVVTKSLMQQFDADEEHVEGLVEQLRRIDSVLVSAMLRENKQGFTKVSLRSDTAAINVADIMKRWDGGGHKMAAGCTIEKPPHEALQELLPVLNSVIAGYLLS